MTAYSELGLFPTTVWIKEEGGMCCLATIMLAMV